MRILAIQPYGDGMGHFGKNSARLCQELAKLGHSVVLCTNCLDVSAYLAEPPLFEVRQLGPTHEFASADANRSRSLLKWAVRRVLTSVAVMRMGLAEARRHRFDVMQLFSYELVSLWILLLLQRRHHLPPITIEVAAPNYSPRRYPGPPLAKLWKLAQTLCLRSMIRREICGFTLFSTSHIGPLRAQLRAPLTFPMCVVSDARPLPNEVLNRRTARQRIGLGNIDLPLLLCFGIFRVEKGHAYLLEAASHLTECDCRILIVGSPLDWSEERMREEIARWAVADRVILHARYVREHEVSDYFFASDAVVLPYSRMYTGSSGPLYDAVAHGRPLIASDVSEMGHLISEHGLGECVPPESPAQLADAIRRFLAASPSERTALERRVMDFARNHTPAAVAGQYERLFRAVANRQSVANDCAA